MDRAARARIVFMIWLAALFATAGSATASTTGAVAGIVKDASTGSLIAGAAVSAASQVTTTSSNGAYSLSALPTGSQKLTAAAAGYLSGSTTVTVSKTTKVTAGAIALTPNSGSVSGTVTDAATLAPIANATVSIVGTTLSAVAGAHGTYALAKVPAGSQTVRVSASGYQAASQGVTVAAGGSATVNIALAVNAIAGPKSGILWGGHDWYLLGANLPWYNYGTDFGTGGWGKYTDWTAIANAFAALQSHGVHVARWWVFADGRYSPDFNSNGAVSGLDPSVLSNVDTALEIAAKNHIYLLFTLMDCSMWNKATFSGSVQMGGHAAIITSASVRQTYLDNALKPFLQHVAAGANAEFVLGYDIVNEPEGNMSGYWGGVNLPVSEVQSFVEQCAAYIHTYAGAARATLGSAMPGYVKTWRNQGLDFYQIHYYPWMDYSNGAGTGLPTCASLALDKPCIVGEFPTADASYGVTDGTPLSARWYLDACYDKGYAGALAWSYGAGDSATAWSSFQPVFTNWSALHAAYVGPQ